MPVRILVVSDSHGQAERLQQIVERVDADHVIHCGDFCTEKSQLPKRPLTVVQGNCDFEQLENEQIWETNQVRFYITHGHRYGVKSSVLSLVDRAKEVGAQIACFGHSHLPYCQQFDGILLVNPGSIAVPRGGMPTTYACIHLTDHQARVLYYLVGGQPFQQLGGVYTLDPKN